MMRLAEHQRDITKCLARYGIKPQRIEAKGSGHLEFFWIAGTKEQSLVISKTPSDHRAPLNNKLRVQRLLKEAGVEPLPPRQRHPNGHRNGHHVGKARSLANLEARIERLEAENRAR